MNIEKRRILYGLALGAYSHMFPAPSLPPDFEGHFHSAAVTEFITSTTEVRLSDTVSPPPYSESLRYGMDTSVNPCDDFYQYVNGGWRRVATLPAPADPKAEFRSFYGFETAVPNVYKRLTAIVDSALAMPGDIQEITLRTVATFYQSCLRADSLESDPFKRLRKTVVATVDSTRQDQCIQRVFQHVGDAAVQLFVEKLRHSTASEKMNRIVSGIMKEAVDRIASNGIMTAEQKKKATQSLSRLKLRVGIPDEVIDYSDLRLSNTEYFKNIQAFKNYSHQRWVKSIGSAPKGKWLSSLLRANGQYFPGEHAIEVPPVWFFPPFFSNDVEDALNFAAVGWVIGHEIYHSIALSIDMTGKEWVGPTDSFRAFTSSLGTLDGWDTNGIRTWNEDLADLGGTRAAYAAWKASVNSGGNALVGATNVHSTKNDIKDAEGFTPDQRFFIAMGRLFRAKWEGKQSPGQHAAPFARVNATVMQMPEFSKAFGCKAGDRMHLAPDQISQIW